MDGPRDYLVGLSQLHEIDSADERRRVWRQGLASLAVAASNQKAAPLEALRPEQLHGSIRAAFATGLVDDTQWMSRGLAAAAFFEIAAVLPAGEEKRELGRRVLEQLLTGDAATFALLATSLASASRRGLSTAPVRSRVAVAMRLPIGIETGVDRLALALLCRPDLEREWLSVPSAGALPARRVAARLLERAAREATRRGLEGDDLGVKTFRRPAVRGAFRRLLTDRDTLVWRHAAAARGLLAAVEPALDQEIERGLSRELGPTDWRRAATSLGAAVAHSPTKRVSRCQDLLHSDLPSRDRGLGAALIFGLGRAAAIEPEAAEALLPHLLEGGELESIEAFVDLLGEHPGWRLAGRSTAMALDKLRSPPPGPPGDPRAEDDGWVALRRALDTDLSPLGSGRRPSVRQHIAAAQMAFVEGREVRPHVEAALGTAGLNLSLLERLREDTSEDRQRGFQLLRELDRGLMESSLLADLLVMSGLEPTSRVPGELGDLIVRLRSWLLAREAAPLASGALAHLELYRRRLRALVHAIDGEGFPMWDESVSGTRERRLRTLDRMLARLSAEPPSQLRRPVCAALARACEGLVRDELAEIGELVLLLGARLERPEDFIVLGEATVASELREVLSAVATLARRLREPADGEAALVAALSVLAEALPPGLTAPVEALRRSLLATARTLERVSSARSLMGLTVGRGTGWLDLLGGCVQDLAELSAGVWRRLNQPQRVVENIVGARPLQELDAAVAHAARGAPSADLDKVVKAAVEGVRADLPRLIGEVVTRALVRLPDLPNEGREDDISAPPEAEFMLPTWLPPSRVLGGFYVQRPIGRGTAGSVFVVCRAEDRHDPGAERFALKIPSYDGSVARMLSEEEFLRLFREEAGALLTLPVHPNLASFVTFDARARPKPILVMELVEGPTIERVLARRDLTFPLAFSILEGIASGLQSMHALGIGHLDVKPANVIMRAIEVPPDSAALHLSAVTLPAVLVDFGLAGRKVRPGCASPFYGAPEVWVTEGAGPPAEPAPADVYSFCCLAYELFVGRRLFQGDTLPAVVAAHFAHDGAPDGLSALRADRRFASLVDVLEAGLRADPRKRVGMAGLRAELARVEPTLREESWPLGVELAA